MQRLRCGVILLDGFIDHLAECAVSRPGGDGTHIASLEYVRCIEGTQAGEEWAELGLIHRGNLSAECVFEIKKGYPTLYNDPVLTKRCKEISEYFLESGVVHPLDIRMASEDFSYFSQECPSCFFRVGVANAKKNITHLVHTPYFNIDDKSLEIGVGLMSYLTIFNLLDQKKF